MFRVPAVRDYQVVQTSGHELRVRIEAAEGENFNLADVRKAVDGEFAKARIRTPVDLDYEVVDFIGPDERTGKVRRVIPLG